MTRKVIREKNPEHYYSIFPFADAPFILRTHQPVAAAQLEKVVGGPFRFTRTASTVVICANETGFTKSRRRPDFIPHLYAGEFGDDPGYLEALRRFDALRATKKMPPFAKVLSETADDLQKTISALRKRWAVQIRDYVRPHSKREWPLPTNPTFPSFRGTVVIGMMRGQTFAGFRLSSEDIRIVQRFIETTGES